MLHFSRIIFVEKLTNLSVTLLELPAKLLDLSLIHTAPFERRFCDLSCRVNKDSQGRRADESKRKDDIAEGRAEEAGLLGKKGLVLYEIVQQGAAQNAGNEKHRPELVSKNEIFNGVKLAHSENPLSVWVRLGQRVQSLAEHFSISADSCPCNCRSIEKFLQPKLAAV